MRASPSVGSTDGDLGFDLKDLLGDTSFVVHNPSGQVRQRLVMMLVALTLRQVTVVGDGDTARSMDQDFDAVTTSLVSTTLYPRSPSPTPPLILAASPALASSAPTSLGRSSDGPFALPLPCPPQPPLDKSGTGVRSSATVEYHAGSVQRTAELVNASSSCSATGKRSASQAGLLEGRRATKPKASPPEDDDADGDDDVVDFRGFKMPDGRE